MDINSLNLIIEKKISQNISCEKIIIEDKTYLHKNHKGHEKNKFHIKLTIKSDELLKMNRIESTKKIYKILDYELKYHIHSIEVLLN
jgi:Stress-induced morphogen (activity unknown)